MPRLLHAAFAVLAVALLSAFTPEQIAAYSRSLEGQPAAPGWACPVQGPRSFSDTWGNARSGGRRHQGTDIMSPRGTPVVASVGGVVRASTSAAGGVSYYLSGDDGVRYFGAHLDRLSGARGRVEQGTVLGWVGNSGNARRGATHLHFEMNPGGRGAVNPFATVATHC